MRGEARRVSRREDPEQRGAALGRSALAGASFRTIWGRVLLSVMRCREGANPAAAPASGLLGKVTQALPLKRFNLQHHLRYFRGQEEKSQKDQVNAVD